MRQTPSGVWNDRARTGAVALGIRSNEADAFRRLEFHPNIRCPRCDDTLQ